MGVGALVMLFGAASELACIKHVYDDGGTYSVKHLNESFKIIILHLHSLGECHA